MDIREARKLYRPVETTEGAGVRLKRVFGGQDAAALDPFLLFDDFSSTVTDDYIAGFPWHPHRGIQTVTYILDGEVEHKDSIGNEGSIGAGDVQWMSAGSGIIHQEMPRARRAGIRGFQLWVNLPRDEKMSAPRYSDVRSSTIPYAAGNGAQVRVIAGLHGEIRGAVEEANGSPVYLDVALEKDRAFVLPVRAQDTVLVYALSGTPLMGENRVPLPEGVLAALGPGDTVKIAGGTETRFLLLAGTPFGEPIAWRGPIVMNTAEEISVALGELRDGSFIKK